jgi:hypothetical protein
VRSYIINYALVSDISFAEKLLKSILMQGSYQTALEENLQAITVASNRFEKAVQFCSYEHIMSVRLDIRDGQSLSKENYQELLRESEQLKQKSLYQNAEPNETISSEAAGMRQVMLFMMSRLRALEMAISGFVSSSSFVSTSGPNLTSPSLTSLDSKQWCNSNNGPFQSRGESRNSGFLSIWMLY